MGFLGAALLCAVAAHSVATHHSVGSWPCAFYVAPSGNDASNGTSLESPFRTLGRAQTALRALPRPLTGRAMACIRAGTYAESITLSDLDGGSGPGTETGFVAYANEHVAISGAVPVTFAPVQPGDPGWEFLAPSVRSAVLVASMTAANVTDFGEWRVQGGFGGCKGPPLELLYAGIAQEVARWPNRESGAWGGPYTITTPSWESASDALFANVSDAYWGWADTSDIWLHGYWWWDWNDVLIKPGQRSTWDNATGFIPLVAGPGVSNVSGAARYYALNSLSGIDAPEEYFLNRSSGALYWLPPAGTPPGAPGTSVSAGGARVNAFSMNGGTLSHFALVGLTFWGSRGSAVAIAGSGSGVLLLNLTVTHAGLTGIDVYGIDDVLVQVSALLGVSEIHQCIAASVQGCNVSGTGGSGISVGGTDDRVSLVSSQRRVTDCVVHDFERVCFTYAPGIAVSGTGALVARNEVFNSAHFGM